MTRFDQIFKAAKGRPDNPETTSADVPLATKPLAKSVDPSYVRTTVYLPKALHQKLKTAAIFDDMDMSVIVASSLEAWFDAKGSDKPTNHKDG